jgi:hypothetical protein
VAVLQQLPGGRNTDHPGAEDDDLHRRASVHRRDHPDLDIEPLRRQPRLDAGPPGV